MTAGTIQRWEQGAPISTKRVRAACVALGEDVDKLVGNLTSAPLIPEEARLTVEEDGTRLTSKGHVAQERSTERTQHSI